MTDTLSARPEDMLRPDPDAPPVQVALAQAAMDVGAVPKSDTNRDQGFAYRGIERIMTAAGPALHKAGVVVLPRVLDVHRETMERGAQRNVWRLVALTVQYDFVGPAGDVLTAVVIGEGLDNGDKAVSKAMTMAYKVALLQALQIGDGTNDPDAESPPEQPSASTAAQPTAPSSAPVVSDATAESLLAKAKEAQMTDEDIAGAVKVATGGRTETLAEVAKSEVPRLRRLLSGEARSAAEDPGRPFEPAGETTP